MTFFRLYNMRKKLSSIFIFLLTVPLIAQENHDMINNLEIGRELLIGGSSVKFIGVKSDSRCPKGVTCIWPGEAKLVLGIHFDGRYFEKEVVIQGTGGEFPVSEDFRIQVYNLSPYPEATKPIAPEDYRLSISAEFGSEG